MAFHRQIIFALATCFSTAAMAAGGTLTVKGTGVLQGSGTLSGNLQVDSGGSIDPDRCFQINDYNPNAGSTLTIDLDGYTACTDYDQLQVTGAINLASGNLVVNRTVAYSILSSITIVTNDGADPVSGFFLGLPEDSQITLNGQIWYISYQGGDGNDVTLTYKYDDDNDGVLNNVDQCATSDGHLSADFDGDGCDDVDEDTDDDNDGVEDSADACMTADFNLAVDLDNDGCDDTNEDLDDDNDGYTDEDEAINSTDPNDPTSLPLDADGDLVSDLSDIDTDGDGLIEISTLAELNNVRNNLAGTAYNDGVTESTQGCGNNDTVLACNGYELTADLDFDEDGEGDLDDTYNTGIGWSPIGDSSAGFTGIFEGNHYRIRNLVINASTDYVGFFAKADTTADIRNLTLDGELTAITSTGGLVGTLVGENRGTIQYVAVDAEVSGGVNTGGLVGTNVGGNIHNSYTKGSVSTTAVLAHVGGLAGYTDGASTVTNVYSEMNVAGVDGLSQPAGLVSSFSGTLTNAYARGAVGSGAVVGGLTAGGSGTANDAYWDTSISGQLASASGTGQTTGELQTPTSNTGIYASWSTSDWDFGTDFQYPVLIFNGVVQRDTDGDGAFDQNDNDDDGDGVDDATDACPLDGGASDLDTDGDGLCDAGADNDDDADGVADDSDSCLTTDLNLSSDADNDGCDDADEDLDDDNDGVDDSSDSEPTNPNVCGVNVDGDAFDDCASGTNNPVYDGDADADGIPDGTDPDDDNDGVTDVNEIDRGSDPFDPNDYIDLDKPTVTAPANITVAATDASGTSKLEDNIALFLSLATATDNVDGVMTSIEQDAPDTLPMGTTTVTFSATDEAGNTGEATATVTVEDLTAPVITLNGDTSVTVNIGETYTEAGATAVDNVDGDISADIEITGSVDTGTLGTYTVTYEVADNAENEAMVVTRTVSVQDPFAPVVTVPESITVAATDTGGTAATHADIAAFLAAASALDDVDGVIAGPLNNDAPAVFPLGTTTVTFSAEDVSGNIGQGSASVTVTDQDAPTITLNGNASITLSVGDSYSEPGATASDNVDGDLTASIQVTGSVDTASVGVYNLTYSVSDAAGNAASTLTRKITVQDTAAPVVTPPASITVAAVDASGTPDTDADIAAFLAAATATDDVDGDIGTVTNNAPAAFPLGVTTVTFTAEDSQGNEGLAQATVTVADQTAPEISLIGDAAITVSANGGYTDAGVSATDNVDGDISASVVTDGAVDDTTPGVYVLTFTSTDAAGNSASTTRTVTVADDAAPVITPPSDLTVEATSGAGIDATDAAVQAFLTGATALDAVDGAVTVITHNAPAVLPLGDTVVTFSADDAAGNTGTAQATVSVVDTGKPVLTLTGDALMTVLVDGLYSEPGASATDTIDGDISADIVISGSVNTAQVGSYVLTYNVSDASGNAADAVTRTVVVADQSAPVITLNGDASLTIAQGSAYSDAGASALDNYDGDLSASIAVTGTVDSNTVGVYTLSFNVSDAAGNAATTVTRTVTVTDQTAPVISLSGSGSLTIAQGATYSDAGATASDNNDGDLSASIVVTGTVDTATTGVYTLTYNVSDAAGNAATPVTRTVTVTDQTAPVLSLNGDAALTVAQDSTYSDAGATATDNNDGDLTGNIQVTGSVNTSTVGVYTLTYNVSDAAGNAATPVTRTVTVTDQTAPVIALTGDAALTIAQGSSYSDAGATASDNNDGDLTASIQLTGSVDTNTVGVYALTYNVSDAAGNAATPVTRTVTVADQTPPVISLTGNSALTIAQGTAYNDAGATASDNNDGDVTANIQLTGSVDTTATGVYTLTYNVSDAAGNAATPITRTVTVTDQTAPVISLNGNATLTVAQDSTYTDAGATASDNNDGDLTASIQVTGSVNTAAVGVYTLTYNVSDVAGNAATPVTRTVTVTDQTAPVITLTGEATLTIAQGSIYSDAGAIAADNNDGNLTGSIQVTGSVDTATVGVYTLTYSVSDAAGNAATSVTRTVTVTDQTKPVLTLIGDAALTVAQDATYDDAGATALDNNDGDITASISVTGSVDTATTGVYVLTYNVSDAAGNAADSITRTVTVADQTPPVITLNGESPLTVAQGSTYSDAGATASDNNDGNLTANIKVTGSVDTNTTGTYTLSYNVSDAAGNAADTVTRTVVVEDQNKPVITLLGEASLTIAQGSVYSDAGATAADNNDGDLTASIQVTGTVDVNTVGVYTLNYNVADAAGNAADTVTRTVTVTDQSKPVITLLGDAALTVAQGSDYTDAGAQAADNNDGDISASIQVSGTVNTASTGVYTLTYTVSDAGGNAADPVERVVTVTDQTAPEITLNGDADLTIAHGSTYDDAGATALDNNDGDLTAQIAMTGSVDADTLGDYTLTYNVADAAGNDAEAVTRTVHVTDQTAPVVTAPANILIAVSDNLGLAADDTRIAAFLDAVTADDVIDGVLTNISNDAPDHFPLGVTTVTFTVTDAAGNTGDAEATVTLADQSAPVVTAPSDIEVAAIDADGTPITDAAIAIFLSLATASDSVEGVIANISHDAPDVLPLGDTTVTFSATDSADNTGEATAVVTVTDLSKPVITLLGDVSVTINVGETYEDAGAEASDNVDGNITGSITLIGEVDTTSVGIYTLTYDVSDAAGNAAMTVSRSVSVQDPFAPVVTAPAAIVVAATNAAGTAATHMAIADFLNGATAIDGVDGTLDVSHDAPAVFALGVTTVTFSAEDLSGNIGFAQATVTVTDQTAPVITLDGDAQITLNVGDVYVEPGATATDNVDAFVSVEIEGAVDTASVGLYNLVYSASDAAGNAAEMLIRQISVQDPDAPHLTVPADITVSAVDASGAPADDVEIEAFLAAATANDEVDGELEVSHDAPDVFPLGITVVSFEAEDLSGNRTVVQARVTVVDTTAPVLTLNGDARLTHIAGEAYDDAGATAIDNVDGDISAAIVVVNSMDSEAPGSYSVNFTVTDAAGNVTTAQRIVDVIDGHAPVITVPADITVEALSADGIPAGREVIQRFLGGATATDDQDGDSLVVTHDFTKAFVALGETTVTFSATDTAGNQSQAMARIQVADTTAPALTLIGGDLIKLALNATYEEYGYIAVDAVDGNLTNQVEVLGNVDTANAGRYLVEYSVTDANGNLAFVSRQVEVGDLIAVKPAPEDTSGGDDSSGSFPAISLLILALAGLRLRRR